MFEATIADVQRSLGIKAVFSPLGITLAFVVIGLPRIERDPESRDLEDRPVATIVVVLICCVALVCCSRAPRNEDTSRFACVAEEFARALIAREYPRAHAMTTDGYRAHTSTAALQ